MRGMGRIFQRKGSAHWWIAYSYRGREYRESARSEKAADARRLLKKRLKEILGDRFVPPSQERVLLSELLDGLLLNYRNNGRKSLRVLEYRLKPLLDAFGLDRAVDVTEPRIERYKATRLAEGKAPATVNRELSALRRAFRLAVKQKRLTSAPAVECLTEHNVRTGFFERGEFEAVVTHLSEHLRDFARFGYLSGWRKGEIASLTWADVDREGRVIRLRPEASKTDEGRTLTLEGELWEIVERRWSARQVPTPEGARLIPWVFHRAGRPIRDIRGAWASACQAAGLEGKLFHDLRRTAVRNMVRAGVPQSVAMKISGHKTRSIFDRYDITDEADIREAVRRTQAHLSTQPTEQTVVRLHEARERAVR